MRPNNSQGTPTQLNSVNTLDGGDRLRQAICESIKTLDAVWFCLRAVMESKQVILTYRRTHDVCVARKPYIISIKMEVELGLISINFTPIESSQG